jgi:hypothetical protein
MAKDNELKESVKEPLKELVKEIVSDTVYKLAKASAKKTVIALRDRLKEEAARRLEEKLKEAAEKRLKQTAKKLGKEFSQDTPQSREYISKIKNGFEKGFQKLLSPPSVGLLIPIVIASVFVVGGLIGWRVTDHFIKPPPQPDLVISAITFDIELIAEAEFPSEEFAPASSYNVTIHYTIENQGDKEAGASTTLLYIGGEPLTDTVDPLPVGGAREESFPPYPLSEEYFYLDMYTYGHVYLELCADGGGNVAESNEENNCTTIHFNPLD